MRMWTTVATATALITLVLPGCRREPTFDERYASAQTALRSEASDIDSELSAHESEAAAADAVLGAASPATVPTQR